MYLNFILTVLCILLLAFLVSGYFLVKKIGNFLSKNKGLASNPIEQTKQLMESINRIPNFYNKIPRNK